VRGRQSRREGEERDHVPGVKLAVTGSGEDRGRGRVVALSGSGSGGRRDVMSSLVAWCDSGCIVVVAAAIAVVVVSHHCGHHT